jgi:hypothetical protein
LFFDQKIISKPSKQKWQRKNEKPALENLLARSAAHMLTCYQITLTGVMKDITN